MAGGCFISGPLHALVANRMERSILLTGASGFLGSRLLGRVAARRARVVCLGRRRPAAGAANIEFVSGDLLHVESCRRALAGCDTVLHLAAATGKHPRAEYFRINRGGTEVLLRQAREAGVARFLYVSTIAAKFNDRAHYHYAESKEQAEELVRESGLNWTIIRPTMIFGPGSPVQGGLERIASFPVIPVFGNGRTPVQPIFVEDAADAIARVLDSSLFDRRIVEIGGPEVLGIEELLLRMRRVAGVGNRRAIHLPVGPLAACLAAIEPVLRPLLPITAGQLASFKNAGTAAHDCSVADWQSGMRRVDQMLS
jgi:NADH dehydrogenase